MRRKSAQFFRIFCYLNILVLFLYSGSVWAAKPSADVCYGCHSQLKKDFAKNTVHEPVRKGQCTACHDPHTSNQGKFLKKDPKELCYSCHRGLEKELQNGNVHTVVLNEKCTVCHNPHATNLGALLAKEPNKLCLACHESVKKQLNLAHAIPPFREGKCLSCHRPHVSAEQGLIKKKSNQLCQSCHEIRCKANGIALAPLLKNADCITCHNPHASQKKGIFNPYAHESFAGGKCDSCHDLGGGAKNFKLKQPVKTLCVSCHPNKKETSKAYVHMNSGGKHCTTCHNPHAAMSKSQIWKNEKWLCFSCHSDTERREKLSVERQKGIKCTGITSGKCSNCHDPHASDWPHNLKKDGVEVCAECHKKEHSVSHPLKDRATDPRTGQPIYCTTCHGMHTADYKFMLHFDRKKELCMQCHKKE